AQGYYQALKDHQMEVDENLVLRLPYQFEEEQESEAFFRSRDIDAVLCVNEIFAIRCMRHAQKKGLKIPEDISFIGFTDGILSKFASPKLTSVAQHGEKMGEIAAEMLIEKVENEVEEGEEIFKTEILKATLVERESTIN
ncbi:MAG: substrate-binding domain-containing protein, partial [Flavobacteriaceae bacterium]